MKHVKSDCDPSEQHVSTTRDSRGTITSQDSGGRVDIDEVVRNIPRSGQDMPKPLPKGK